MKNKTNNALWITEKSKDSTFINCDIEGATIEGYRSKFINTKIYAFTKKYPWKTAILGIGITVFAGVILLIIEKLFF